MTRRSAALSIVVTAAIAAGLLSEHIRQVWIQPLWVPLADLAVGWSLVVCGAFAAATRPAQPAGRRLVVAGFLWIVAAPRQWFGGLGRTDDFLQLDAASFSLVGWSDVVLAFTALAFATRLPARRRDRIGAACLVVAFGAQTAVRLVYSWPALAGADLVPRDDIYPWLAFADIARLVALAGAGVLLVDRWVRSSRSTRHLLGPVLLAGAASCLVPLYGMWYPLSQLGLFSPAVEDVAVPGFWLTNSVRILVPIAMLVGILRQRRGRGAVAEALARLEGRPTAMALEQALAAALGDPSLRVEAWDPVTGPSASSAKASRVAPTGQAITPVVGDDGPLAMLVHDPALSEDPMALAAGAAMARLVLDNERLGRELQRQLDEVRASRARIVEAGDAERRRIERDLHDGVQQRLLALGLALRRAAGGVADGAAAEALARGADEAAAVIEDVRHLAHGIHPAVLTEAGLPAALQSLAIRSPVPVELDIAIAAAAIRPSAAAAAYFVASEALANVVKHADASRVRVAATDAGSHIRVVVEDDGRGGADALGNGFRGLADRVAAVGGTLSVGERPGGGTTVTATVPAR